MGSENPEWTELEAIRRAQLGEAAAFEYLYRTYSRRVYRICLRMLKNTFDAEDLTQMIFLQVFRKIGTFRGNSAFATWLQRVTINAVLMHLRRKVPAEISTVSRDDDSEPDDSLLEAAQQDRTMFGAVERLHIARALRRLPSSCKRVFLLHHVMGYEYCEIAELAGCTLACTKSRIHRAVQLLRHYVRTKQVHERRLPA